MDNVKQHIIPQGYLSAWADPAAPQGRIGWVRVIQKSNNADNVLRAPKNYFWEADRYTVNERNWRNTNVEKALGTIENDFGKVMRVLKANEPITGTHRVILLFFSAAMLSRTDHYPERIGALLRRVQDQAARLAGKDNREPVFAHQVQESLVKLKPESVSIGIPVIADVLNRMHLSIFTTDDDAGFVTGDNPCCVCVPGDWHPFLGHPDVEFTLPLSPRHLAFYSWKVPPTTYAKLGATKVNEVNSRTIGSCRKEFVSWKGTVRDEWFAVDYRRP